MQNSSECTWKTEGASGPETSNNGAEREAKRRSLETAREAGSNVDLQNGWCYLKFFNPVRWDNLVNRLGPWPSLESLENVWDENLDGGLKAALHKVYDDNGRVDAFRVHASSDRAGSLFWGELGQVRRSSLMFTLLGVNIRYATFGGVSAAAPESGTPTLRVCTDEPAAKGYFAKAFQEQSEIGVKKITSNSYFAGLAPSSLENCCWSELFPECEGEYMTLGEFRGLCKSRYLALKEEEKRLGMPNKLAWTFMTVITTPFGWHVCDPSWANKDGTKLHLTGVINKITLLARADPSVLRLPVGLTAIMVLGTIGDVQPAVEAAISTNLEAIIAPLSLPEKISKGTKLIGVGDRIYWGALVKWCPEAAKVVRELGPGPGEVAMLGSVLNELPEVRYKQGASFIDFSCPTNRAPGFLEDQWYTLKCYGDPEYPAPDDLVVATHPEHEPFIKAKYPWAEFRSVPVPVNEFIALGQELMKIGNFISFGPGIRKLNQWLLDAFYEFVKLAEMSDLVFVVSGAVVAPFLNSLYKGTKKVFEVCPVPRGEGTAAPEFYLSCLFDKLELPPKFTRDLSRHLEVLMAKSLTSRTGLELRRCPPPKIQCAPWWALDLYEVRGLCVPFKPWSKFLRREEVMPLTHRPWSRAGFKGVVFTGRDCKCGFGSGKYCLCALKGMDVIPPGVLRCDPLREVYRDLPLSRPSVYYSLGSCEKINARAIAVAEELAGGEYDITVDSRWNHLFPSGRCTVAPYREHADFLANFDLVIHHGGAGVTYTCVEIGVWQMILYQVGDQVEWMRATRRLGVAVDSLSSTEWREMRTPGRPMPQDCVAPPLASQSRIWTLHPPDVFPEVPRLAGKKLYELALKEGFSHKGLFTCAYWELTGSTPPHFTPKFSPAKLREVGEKIVRDMSTEGDDQLKRVAMAVLAELGLARRRDIIKNFPLMGIFKGHSSVARFVKSYAYLSKDWAAHVMRFAESVGMEVPVKIPEPIGELAVTGFLPSKFGFPTSVDTVADVMAFRKQVAEVCPPTTHAYVYLRPLFGRLGGPVFNAMHAILEWKGKFVELQRVRDGLNLVVEWETCQGALGSGSWCKMVAVPVPHTFHWCRKDLASQFDGNKYRSLGDNCLFLVNYIIHQHVGRIVPWKHFGAYGADIPTSIGQFFGEWVAGQWRGVKGDRKIEVIQTPDASRFLKIIDMPRLDRCHGALEEAKVQVYGRDSYMQVAAFMSSAPVQAAMGLQTATETLEALAWLATSKFRLTGGMLHGALSWGAARSIRWTSEEYRLLIVLGKKFEIGLHNPYVDQVCAATVSTRKWWGVRKRAKVVWAPLFQIHTPHHWLYSPDTGGFTTTVTASDRLSLEPGQRVVKLSLPQILTKYESIFPEVAFPNIRMRRVHQGEYICETRVPLRRNFPQVTPDFQMVVDELRAATGAQAGVFSMRYATIDMAEAITDRYFTGVDTGFLDDEYRQRLADAIVAGDPDRYLHTKLMAPEDTFKKWNTKYSAGFPYRFNQRGNAKRADLIRAVGGREKFLEAIRCYVESPDKFPSVSHVFIKDEILPESDKEKGKVRTVIAQDLLSYFTQMAVEGDMNKRMNPLATSALGVSPQHGGMSKQAELHLPFKHHYANDITALDSRLCWDYFDIATRVRKRGFDDHPQRDAIHDLLDVTAENLYCSWLVDIYTGRSRFKTQGASTGHASTTSTNTLYVEAMYLDAWVHLTKRPVEEFYENVKLSTYADDNYYSTSLPRDVYGPEVIQDYLATRGVHVKLEASSDSIDDISFLAKWFSTKLDDIEHARETTGVAPPVCVIHDRQRLIMKFSDCKGKSDLRTRWSKTVSLLDNCAHHPDLHRIAWDYLQTTLEPRMRKRPATRRWMETNKPRRYQDVMRLMYLGEDGAVPFTREAMSAAEEIHLFFEGLRKDIMAWDGSVLSSSRLLERWAGVGAMFSLKTEDQGADTSNFARAHLDQEFIMERHIYVHAGMPSDIATLRRLGRQSPFSDFLRWEEFWTRRDEWIHSDNDIQSLNFGVSCLFMCYAFVVWLDHNATKVPILGPLYRAFTSLEAMTAEMYANLNTFYFTMFGCSSTAISSLIPKDRKSFQKHMAITLWGKFTHMLPSFDGGMPPGFKDMVNEWCGVIAMSHSLIMKGEFWLLAPVTEATAADVPTAETWVPLDHSDSVERCKDILAKGGVPLVTSSTGAGKSTDFVCSLKKQFDTVYLSVPRQILAKTSPIAQTRVYAGSDQRLQAGKVNVVTHGYLELVLSTLGPREIIILDEFHELDEASLILLERFQGQVVCLTATPPKYRKDLFTEVRLTKSRNANFGVSEEHLVEMKDIATQVVMKVSENRGEKTMVVLPSVRQCYQISSALERACPGLATSIVSRNSPDIDPACMVYLCTTIVDAGLTIPGVTLVIDSGRSVGWKDGVFKTWYSSKATYEQRRGRTGRTCNGKYIRLTKRWDEGKMDFSTAFACNKPHLARDFGETRKMPTFDSMLGFLPGLYNPIVKQGDVSMIVFFYLLTTNRGDIAKTKEGYQRILRDPLSGDTGHLMEVFGNPPLCSIESTLRKVDKWENQGGNFINPVTGEIEKLSFATELPIAEGLLKAGVLGHKSKLVGRTFDVGGQWHPGDIYPKGFGLA